jgi:phage terminase large subunit-like protein
VRAGPKAEVTAGPLDLSALPRSGAQPRLAEQTQIFTSRLYVPHTDSTLAVLPAEPGALQGWNPSLAIVDELHVVTRQVWDAVSLAAGKRDHSLTLASPHPVRPVKA